MSSLFADRVRQELVARFARNGTADHPAWRQAVAFPEPWPSLGGQFKAEDGLASGVGFIRNPDSTRLSGPQVRWRLKQ